jgi:hypothetical protein
MELTQLLALLGTILSTVALTWNILRDIKDRARLKLVAMIGKIYPDHTDRPYFFITMTNIGRRPIMVKGWGCYFRKHPSDNMSAKMMIAKGLPRMLKEGEYHIEYTEDFSILESNVIEIHVWDSRDRKWCLSKKELRRLRADLEKLKSDKDPGIAVILKT